MSEQSLRRQAARSRAKARRNARRRNTRRRLRLESLEQRLLLTTLVGLDAEFLACGGVDLDHLEVTPTPDLTQPLDAATITELESTTQLATLGDTFALHSNANASKTIYLDFDGHTTSGTIWNSAFNSGADIITTAYDFDGNGSSFSDAELQRIQYIWQRVAEDFIGFDVDITTEDPGAAALSKSGSGDSEWGVRVVIGGSSYDWYGAGAGGVAYVGSYNWSSDTPAFVFEAQLGNGHEKYTAEAISHEVGHTLGLSHDGTSSTGYYSGQGSGETGWAPIMGVGYYQNLTQWSKGEYSDANQKQDDLSIITSNNGFGYRADDYGNTDVDAATLTSLDGSVDAYGIIERNTDTDVFSFTTGEGDISLSIDEFSRGANLDILAELFDATGTLITASNPASLLGASINTFVTAGTYYLHISGTGSGDPLTTGYTDYGSIGQYTITGDIVDPSTPPPAVIPTISVSDVILNEEDGNAIFTVNLSEATTNTVTVDIATADDTAFSGSDYLAKSQTLTFAAGETSKTFSVSLLDDTNVESTETFSVNLSNAANATLADAQGIATILDTDAPPAVVPTVSINDVAVNEDDGVATFTVSLSEVTTNVVTVVASTENFTAQAGAGDYVAKSQTLTFAAGETTKTFTVAILDDTEVEIDEAFQVSLSNVIGATVGDGQGFGTIMDNDVIEAVVPKLSIDNVTVNEGDGLATFTVTLSDASAETVTVFASTKNFTAQAGSGDYISTSQKLTFEAGETSKTFTVVINDDTTVENDESFMVNLSGATGAEVADSQGVGTILNDDMVMDVTPEVSINDVTVNEGDGQAVFTVTLSEASSEAITVTASTKNYTAQAGQGDYVSTSQTLTFAAGETTKTFAVAINDDTLIESTEKFMVNLSGATIADGQGVCTIIDNDASTPTDLMLSISDAMVSEDDGLATFTVSLSDAATETVSVMASTKNFSAQVGSGDYLQNSQTLTFNPGEMTQTFSVVIVDDATSESNETFKVMLSRADGATIAEDQAVGTIVDNDGAAAGSSLAEEQAQMQAAWLSAEPMDEASQFSSFLQSYDSADTTDQIDSLLRDVA